ncbi:MAG TPA: ester cyclase [Micromonosporaceae bacterium]|nr:ester cyclase [Micromonosporaceae bacterium]
MSVEDNKQVARRFAVEVWGKGDLAVADELLTDDLINHRTRPGQPGGKEGLLETIRLFHQAFAPRRFIPERFIAERDEVTDSWEMIAFHRGDFFGAAATGQLVTTSGTDWYHVSDGRIHEIWHEQDVFGVLIELSGALP